MDSSYQKIEQSAVDLVALCPDDLDEILELERQGYATPWSEQVFRDCFRADYRFRGIRVAGKLAGYSIAACIVDEIHLLNLCVGGRHRKSGLGRRLLRHLVTDAAKEGMTRLLLEVRRSNHAAISLYRSEGLAVIGERPGYYPDGRGREDALVMSLELRLSDDV
ncbi:ribosomal protein S18-alanine N-acetyltransferase [Marinobacter sp.]|uniref:ribosomal protein S18-alanine N-acetyltransferase n=1 Tax=Marinobacter sp. TaxID=50741 RepID=UPI0025C5AD69|nr:ribosomal protein S18-alanine N-acetyltransferase [Marinobacter sp.]